MTTTITYTPESLFKTLITRTPYEQLIIMSAMKEIGIRDQEFELANFFRDKERALARDVFPNHYMDRAVEIAQTGPVGRKGRKANRKLRAAKKAA